MVKRAILTKDKFRISIPSVDVDTASEHQFILHESYLAAQPYWANWVPCPFAGAGNGNYEESVPVTVPTDIANPFVLLIPRGATGNNYYPGVLTFSGNFPTAWADAWTVNFIGAPPTITVNFFKQGQASAPEGAWLVLIRKE